MAPTATTATATVNIQKNAVSSPDEHVTPLESPTDSAVSSFFAPASYRSSISSVSSSSEFPAKEDLDTNNKASQEHQTTPQEERQRQQQRYPPPRRVQTAPASTTFASSQQQQQPTKKHLIRVDAMSRDFPPPARQATLEEMLAQPPGKWSLKGYVQRAREDVKGTTMAEDDAAGAAKRARAFADAKLALLRDSDVLNDRIGGLP
ncbi:hypothetical protein B0T26DRAFT_750267 [Lasiosphaeria miniovina]|uniref:Uncharacterized protein n=1 Tax=Lasiosphaeria miniovina TaxID=1954250 RepID=A0AA40AVV8_9PEZI|nr:uncharacterized protein B0T26DRAFT_750267 [Lasiosphaeria miniovina]KAK0722926.1 hypothetical protein B0T26DRAFT_750267 [Lasiosphaeria miniovina]